MIAALSNDIVRWTATFTRTDISANGLRFGGSSHGPAETAGAAPGGGPGVKIGKPIVSTDKKQASEKGQALGNLLRSGKLKPEDKEQISHLLMFYEGPAYEDFVSELSDAVSGTDGAVREFVGEQLEKNGPEPRDNESILSADSTLIIPTGEAKADRGGFRVQYSAQIYEETGESTSVEVYTDVSASAGIGVDIPLAKLVKLKFSVDAKHGKKWTEKSETKTGTRTGRTISRTFTVRHMQREIFNVQSKKIYHNPRPVASGFDGTTYMAKSVTHEQVGVNPDIQHGYMVVPDEGGAPWGPFWSEFKGYEADNQSGLREAWDVLGKEQKKIAEDLVFGPPGG